MLRNLTAEASIRRTGHDDGYFGRPKKPPFNTNILLAAYLAGYQIGHAQRQLEVEDGTHPSLLSGAKVRLYKLRS